MALHEAIKTASSRGMDLVEIAAGSKPPVCKIIDYGKYSYEKQKKDKLQKKNQNVMTVKEIRFNANTDSHDIEFKTKHLRQFLLDGHKVKTSVLYKGRMITHPEIGQKLMSEVLEKLTDIGKIDSKPKLEGKMLTCFLVPDKNKILSYNARLAKEKKKEETMKPEETATGEEVKEEAATGEEVKQEVVNTVQEETTTQTEN